MTSLSSRLPAYFVVPISLPEEDVLRFQGHGIPVSTSGNPNSHGLLINPFWQVILFKTLGFGPLSKSDPKISQGLTKRVSDMRLPGTALKFSQMQSSF